MTFGMPWWAHNCSPLNIARVSIVLGLGTSFSSKLATIMVSPLLFSRWPQCVPYCDKK